MKIKNLVASVVVVLGLTSFAGVLSCKSSTPNDIVDAGAGGGVTSASSASTSASSTSTSAVGSGGGGGVGGQGGNGGAGGESFVEVCDAKCPKKLPKSGESCEEYLNQYCEYAQGACRSARCRTNTGVWEVREMDPCVCYEPPFSSQE